MGGGEVSDSHDFNLGNMVFIPKKAAGVDPVLGEFFTASDVRPLVIVNTDNRIIANAMPSLVEPILEKWISENQRGFLPGRNMLANVVDVEHRAHEIALKHSKGAVFLMDFKAAFPSLCHRYMHRVLEALGVPKHLRNMVSMLYHEHRCRIIFGGGCHEGFDIKAGIRQGCPLSPLLFALVAHLLLRRMVRRLPECSVRAFADDVAIVALDLESALQSCKRYLQTRLA